ncbi:MAG TPA: hydroxymethylglutaryl-CoA lyase [Woeseiaceae bacterium]|nr:hydroxymethylglutaryl-CoA lyase [Woeseiaceae bacterium]
MSEKVEISEVGPRDGLQNLAAIMPTSVKKRWITAEAEAGVSEIEVGSFVSPKLFPQLADTAEVVAHALQIPDLCVAALVPNVQGLKDAIRAGVHKLSIPVSVSEKHSLANLRKPVSEMIAEVRRIVDEVRSLPASSQPKIEVGLATAFGCSIEGPVAEDTVVRIAGLLMNAGCDEIGLSDTSGYANPRQVTRLVRRVKSEVGDDGLQSLHLHNTRGLGLANAAAGLEEGIRTLDSSLGGLGGCPAAPGASGNIVTEDLVFMLESMGLDTGIDLNALLETREIIKSAMPDVELFGMVPEAGLPLGFLG